MDRLTENDRGTFVVTTRSGTRHVWEITDESVTILRAASRGPHHPSMTGFTDEPYRAEVLHWPEVGGCFAALINPGDDDYMGPPWTRSSTIRSIERLAR